MQLVVPHFRNTKTEYICNAPEDASAPLEYALMAREKYGKRHSADDEHFLDPPVGVNASVVDTFRKKDESEKDGRPYSELSEQHSSSPQSMTGLHVSIDLLSRLSKKCV